MNAPKDCPANKREIFDKEDKSPASCIVVNSKGEKHPKSDAWCVNANPNQAREKELTMNYMSFPQPVGFCEKAGEQNCHD